MRNFFDKTEYKADDLIELINSEAEESVYLEFKDSQAIDRQEGKKKEITKDVVAFANSDGGLIIYEISEEGNM